MGTTDGAGLREVGSPARDDPRWGWLWAASVWAWLALELLSLVSSSRGSTWADLPLLVGVEGVFLGLLLLPAALLWRRTPRGSAGALLLLVPTLWALLAWRFELFVNRHLISLAVIGGWGGILSLGVGLAWILGRGFAAHPRGLLRGLWGVGGLAWLLLPLRMAGPEAGVGDGPDVVLITLDTVRADRLTAVATPHLDALGGLRFSQAIAAAPQTGPAHLALLDGRWPARQGVFANGSSVALGEGLASVLQRQGWSTGAFIGGFPLSRRFGFAAGFDVYDDSLSSPHQLHRLLALRLADALHLSQMPRERGGDVVTRRAARWLSAQQGPALLWLHNYDAHAPYVAPDDLPGLPETGAAPLPLPAWWPPALREVSDAAWLRARYDAELRWVDTQVGVLAEAIKARGRPTLWVVVGDHGESLGEHGVFFDHGDDLYDPALRVPLRIAGEGLADARLDCQVSAVDLLPTVLARLGVGDEVVRDGVVIDLDAEVASCVDHPALAASVAARHPNPPLVYASRMPGYKVVSGPDGVRIYELDTDPGEAEGRAPSAEEWAPLRDFVALTAPDRGGQEAARGMLQRLGYLDP